MLPYEYLEVFWLADEYHAFLEYLQPRIREFSEAEANQGHRSRGSFIHNIMEAASDRSPREKAKFFRYARREVVEAFAPVWLGHRAGAVTDAEVRIARYYVDRLSAMLWGLILKWEKTRAKPR